MDAEAPGEIRSADRGDELRIAAHHKLVPGARKPDVQAFSRALQGVAVVDHQHDGAPLESLEAEHVPVEHLFGVPEAVPVSLVALGLPGHLFGVTTAGGQQRDVLGPEPPLNGPAPAIR